MRNKRECIRHAAVLILTVAGLIISTAPSLTSSGLASAQAAAPSWSYTGSLDCGRSGSATLLLNGNVLVAGGCNDSSGRDTGELYNPATGMWSLTGSLNTHRPGHTATLLQNGKVLVAGGLTANSDGINTAELYDPATGVWSFTGSLNKKRVGHTATLLQNGKVLVAGGYNTDDYASKSAELYDPNTEEWNLTGTLVAIDAFGPGRGFHTATLLQSGKVLVAGGQDPGDFAVFATELYDPTTGTWSVSGRLNENRSIHTATLLPNGQVLIAGACNAGIFCGSGASSAELYNPATEIWSVTGAMNTPRFFHTATLLPNGRVLIAGGEQVNFFTGTEVVLNSAEIYDPASGNWSTTANLNGPRLFHAATLLLNGKVLVVGGYGSGSNNLLQSAELYDSGSSSTINPIDDPQFFVRQHYLDFLNREPDPLAAQWISLIINCPTGDTSCDRIHVSEAFFKSPEFQERGYFAYRFYSVSFGRKPDFAEFMPDLARVSGFLTPSELEAAKVSFINDFMARPAFVSRYNGLNNTQYVDALLSTAGVTLSNPQALIDALNSGSQTRGQVLRQIVESTEVFNKHFNQAFVVMQYFGYLRRDPDILYLNWIATLDANPSDSRHMIAGFVNSNEYRARFRP